jgi:uncharacterized protein (DUF885 family)
MSLPHDLGLLLVALALLGCASGPRPAASAAAPAAGDAKLADLASRWLDGLMRENPIDATGIGDHRFDAEIDDLSADGRQRRLAHDERVLAELETIDVATLAREAQVDAAILRNALQRRIFGARVLESWAWDPLVYNRLAGDAIYALMARDFAPIGERLANAAARLEKLPQLLAQARANLDPARVPKIHAETVVKQNKGLLALIDELVVPRAAELPAAERARLEAAIAGFRAAVGEHQGWLETSLLPAARGEARLGRELYDQKLALALSSPLSREEIRRRADAEIARVRGEMYGIARQVLPARQFPETADEAQRQAAIEAALELAYADRPAREAVVDTAKQTLAEATAFTRKANLVTVPDDPVKIILMPEFQRGVAVAYCDSPGPLDKGLETYYAISPIPSDWTQAQVDSFLREYNTRMIHLLSIHEAVPGHWLEGAHSMRHPSVLRAVLRSGAFAEGWAVYTEKVMADAGYLGGDPLFRLVQLKFYLRAVANAILDQGVHVDGWTREQGMELMVKTTFQQESEAAGKWVRAQLTSAQLPTYFVGVQEHFDLRRAVEEREGARFDARAYHDRVLSFGGVPVKHVRALMLDEPVR